MALLVSGSILLNKACLFSFSSNCHLTQNNQSSFVRHARLNSVILIYRTTTSTSSLPQPTPFGTKTITQNNFVYNRHCLLSPKVISSHQLIQLDCSTSTLLPPSPLGTRRSCNDTFAPLSVSLCRVRMVLAS